MSSTCLQFPSVDLLDITHNQNCDLFLAVWAIPNSKKFKSLHAIFTHQLILATLSAARTQVVQLCHKHRSPNRRVPKRAGKSKVSKVNLYPFPEVLLGRGPRGRKV